MAPQRVPSPPPIESGDPTLIPSAAFLVRNRHWTVPLGVFPALALGGFAAHAYGAHTAMMTATGVGSAAVWVMAPHKWDRPVEQWYARLTVLGAGGWLTAVSYYGDTRLMLGVLAGGAVAWGIPWLVHKRPRHQGRTSAAVSQWDAWWQHHCRDWQLFGSAVEDVTSKGVTETVTVKLWAGKHTWRDVESVLGLIESALRGYVRHGMVRLEPHPDFPNKVLLHLKRSNPLAPVIDWDPSMVPASILEPAVLGIGEGGAWIRASLLTNWFIIGRSRWGKSNELSNMLTVITGVPDARAWLIDMKGGRAAKPWMPAVDWVATTIDEARLMFTAALAELKARATHADDSEEQLQPTPEVPAIFVIIDETHEVTSDTNGDARCAHLLSLIASQGMGVAVYVIVVTQYGALAESVRSEQTRSNLLARMCFAVSHREHGQYALSDYHKLDASKLNVKGSFFWQADSKSSSEQARGPHLPHSLVREISRANGAMPREPLRLFAAEVRDGDDRDAQAAAAFVRDAYGNRWSRLPEVFRRYAPQWVPGATPPPPSLEVAGMTEDDDVAEVVARIEDEVAGLPDVPLAEVLGSIPQDWEIRRDVERQKVRWARALALAADGISPKQLMAASGMSRSWTMHMLKALTDAGTVEKPQNGLYRLLPGQDVWAAMEGIGEAGERLLAGTSA